ncbi:MAG: von Willebrand factor type A domain-containing protein [Labilibaculum sp.]|nr:von Willebrand factor type A domain-containing protein [Labilibaculum sp.]MBI9058234.1 von Willebrand factor type A domain-containing protein [Labilibaculum sp.]
MKTKALFLSIIGILIGCNLFANIISGTVYDDSKMPLPGVSIIIKGTIKGVVTDFDGKYSIDTEKEDILVYSFVGMITQEIKIKDQSIINLVLKSSQIGMDEVIVVGYGKRYKRAKKNKSVASHLQGKVAGLNMVMEDCEMEIEDSFIYPINKEFNTEGYSTIRENGYKNAVKSPLSTFSIDVDAASYSNVRRFLTDGRKPPVDAVRIEEMINYFNYDYAQPEGEHPFSINHEVAECPWNSENLLLHIGLQGKKVLNENLPASNLVFLLDVSGSMDSSNKLPLLKKAFKLLVNQLREDDKVAIVVYAGNSGLVLPSTSGNRKKDILEALNRLNAGGSTAGASGLKLAYKVARENFIDGGNNRIIMATDGDFNVGQSSNAELERLIEKEREHGTFISVLGFGMGNYKDDKMEIIADKGNGNYAYIDNILEAKKVLVNEFGGTLFTIAKDVKIQIEFNPAIVAEYRLVGYENRLLANEDFANDKKDAGELGSGHSVTAIYEVKLNENNKKQNQELKYQNTSLNTKAYNKDEIATVKFRYKKPTSKKSTLIEQVIPNSLMAKNELSNNYKFSAAVAGFGLILRESKFKGNCSYDMLINLAQQSKGEDKEGYRSEFIRLMKLANHL